MNLIERQISTIKRRLRSLGRERLTLGTHTYADSERDSERRNLRSMLKDAQARQERSVKAVARDDARERAWAEAEIANTVAVYEWNADRFEAQGDHRNARLYREAIHSVPAEVYRRFGLAG
jgi:hypothetical protein